MAKVKNIVHQHGKGKSNIQMASSIKKGEIAIKTDSNIEAIVTKNDEDTVVEFAPISRFKTINGKSIIVSGNDKNIEIASTGNDFSLVNSTGNSTTNAISQKAATDAANKYMGTISGISVGDCLVGGGNSSSGATSVTISHKAVEANVAPTKSYGTGGLQVLNHIGTDSYGHVVSGSTRVLYEIPAGGTIGQVLVKNSDKDHDVKWADDKEGVPGGGTVTSVKVQGASGLTGSGEVTTKGTITVGHATASTSTTNTATTLSNGGTFVVPTVNRDSYGHITGLTATTYTLPKLLSSIPDEYITETELNGKNYALKTDIPSLSGYATQEWVTNKNYALKTDIPSLSGYATQEWASSNLQPKGEYALKTDIPSLSGYALKSEIPSLDGYATQEWVTNKNYALKTDIPSLSGYATQEWANNTFLNLSGGTLGGELSVTGKVKASEGFYQESDERLKTFGDDIEVDLEKLLKLRKSYFTFNSDVDKLQHIGVSAQEINELYPEMISKNINGYLTVDYSKLAVLSLKAVDVLYEKNKALEERISKIEEMLIK